MRDLIERLNFTESVGLANRRPGEIFRNDAGQELTFQDLAFWPESGQYATLQLLNQAVVAAAEQTGADPERIQWINARPARGGFGLAHFTDADGQDYYFGRYLQKISPNRQQNSFPNTLPGGFRLASRSGQKESSPYKPNQVLTQMQNNTPDTIFEQVKAKFGENSDELRAVSAFYTARDFPVTFARGQINVAAFRDYFMEILHPVALVRGMTLRGNAADAAERFLGSNSFADCTISFSSSAITGLFDSLLVSSDGVQIKISSKGAAGGAAASVSNLERSVSELRGTPAGDSIIKKYPEAIGIIETVKRLDQYAAPIELAVQFRIISEKEGLEVEELRGLSPKDPVIGQNILSRRLEKMYQERLDASRAGSQRAIPYNNMITALAFAVSDYVNEKTNFGAAASTILNNSALVQITTDITESKDTITIRNLTARWPSQSVTGVALWPQKNYSSTQIKGKLGFKILMNGASVEDLDYMDAEVDTKPDTDPREPGGLVDREFKRSAVKAYQEPTEKDNVRVYGRGRQKKA
jgi:hypothetical protein